MIKINLTQEQRKRLEAIIKSNKSTQADKQKAEVLLLTDMGEYGPKVTAAHAADRVGLSKRSVGRIREVYSKNLSIDDVFRFPKLSDQKFTQNEKNEGGESSPTKNRKIRYIEMEDTDNEPLLIENTKYRVILSKEERAQLEAMIKNARQSNRKFTRAKILLLADEGMEGPANSDKEIAEKLDVSILTVVRVRKLLITKGQIDNVLNFNHHKAGRMPKIDGKVQATLVAQACSQPPKGRNRWTVRLLADQLVTLDVIDSISHTAVAEALKKMNLNLGNVKNG
jgi:hypothetical protein